MSSARLPQYPLKRSHPVLAVTMGDMNGIGPEVILKSLALQAHKEAGVLLFASSEAMEYYSRTVNISPFWEVHSHTAVTENTNSADDKNSRPHFSPASKTLPVPQAGEVIIIPSQHSDEKPEPGKLSAASAELAMQAISSAVAACESGHADAIITAPISKEAIHKAGYQVPGHTEYLAHLTGVSSVGMMLVNDHMRIGLATIHIPLRDVAAALTSDRIETQIGIHHHALVHNFGISDPRIAVLGLNPHAGDGGIIGMEEQQIIAPSIKKLQKQNIRVDGPFPADGFFGNKEHEAYDLIFAMYHDQGLIPLKLTGFGKGVNITVGLPIIRTSPDHGTAFSIAGKNKANPGSMKTAITLAHSLAIRKSHA